MIYLNKNSVNTVALSLSELITLTGSSVYFLFRFISDDTKSEMLFTGPDSSMNLQRYNQFIIIETGSTNVNLTASTINLEPKGFWHYEIYQQTGQTNISLTGVSGGPIEYGKVLVSGITSFIKENTYTGQSNTRYVYNI